MPKTRVRSSQLKKIKRADLNTATTGKAVVTKIIAGAGVTISQTGADSGTGDVTLNG